MRLLSCLVLFLFPQLCFAEDYAQQFPDIPEYQERHANEILRQLNYRHGEITLPGGHAVLNITDDFYFLDAADAKKVLGDLWENPNMDTQGMIFPAAYTPWDLEGWGANIIFDDIGYVSDENAGEIDYDDLLETMQADTEAESKWRVEQGYSTISLLGWAETPHYDPVSRKLHWAQELAFGGAPENTLNYNLRALGRKGVLELNFIAGMSQLDQIRGALSQVSNMVSFKEGSRYQDFVPSLDTVAAVGIGGLIAGKVVAKTGFLLIALLFLKKFAIILILPITLLFKKMFGRKS